MRSLATRPPGQKQQRAVLFPPYSTPTTLIILVRFCLFPSYITFPTL